MNEALGYLTPKIKYSYVTCRASFHEKQAWFKHLHHFQQATLDFIQWQHLDYAGMISCLYGYRHVTADGITLG